MTRIFYRIVPGLESWEAWPEGHPGRSQSGYSLPVALGSLVRAEKARLGIELVAFDGSTPAPPVRSPDG